MFIVVEGERSKVYGTEEEFAPPLLVFASETMEFLGNANDSDGVRKIIDKWCRKAKGSRTTLTTILKRFHLSGSKYPIFQREMKEKWENEFEEEWSDRIEEWITTILPQYKIKVKKPLFLAAHTKNKEKAGESSKKFTFAEKKEEERKVILPKKKKKSTTLLVIPKKKSFRLL